MTPTTTNTDNMENDGPTMTRQERRTKRAVKLALLAKRYLSSACLENSGIAVAVRQVACAYTAIGLAFTCTVGTTVMYSNVLAVEAKGHIFIHVRSTAAATAAANTANNAVSIVYHTLESPPQHSISHCLLRKLQLKLYNAHIPNAWPSAYITKQELAAVIRTWLRQRAPQGCGSCAVVWLNPGEGADGGDGDFLCHALAGRLTLILRHSINAIPKEKVVVIIPRYIRRRHSLCFRIIATVRERLQARPGDVMCECCGIPARMLRATPAAAAIRHKTSPVTNICRFVNKSLQSASWTTSQHLLVQYICVASSGATNYVDFFDAHRQRHSRTFADKQGAYVYAEKRHGSLGKRLKWRLLQPFFRSIANEHRAAGGASGNGGTVSQWWRQLERATERITIFLAHADANHAWESEPVHIAAWRKKGQIRLIGKTAAHKLHGFQGRGYRCVIAQQLCPGTDDANVFDNVRNFYNFMHEYFGVECLTSSATSFPVLTYEALFYSCATADPMYRGQETLSPALLRMLRQKQMHQWSYSAMPFIAKGERPSPRHEPAEGYVELDLSLAYSSSLARLPVPVGSPVIYSRLPGATDTRTLRRAKALSPSASGEMALVYHHIRQLAQHRDVVIYAAYHKFNGAGQFRVGKYSLDLLVSYGCGDVRVRRTVAAFQFHHAYTHGCRVCNTLNSYAGGKTHEEITRQSDAVDAFWRQYCLVAWGVDLSIVYHCHRMDLDGRSWDSVLDMFQHNAWLQDMCFPRATIRRRTINHDREGWRWLHDLCSPGASTVVFVVAEGHQTGATSPEDNCVFTKGEHGPAAAEFCTLGPTLFIGQYLLLLGRDRGFRVTKLHHVIVYTGSDAMQPMFQTLLQTRTAAAENNFYRKQLKLCCNAFIGMAGRVSDVACKTYYYTGPLSIASEFGRYDLSPTRWAHIAKCTFTRRLAAWRQNLLPLSVAALQYYRLHMLRAKMTLQRLCRPELVRIVQCHVDSFFIVLGRDTLQDCAKDPRQFREQWLQQWQSDKKQPGKFHIVRRSTPGKHFSIVMPSISTLRIDDDDTDPAKNAEENVARSRQRLLGYYRNPRMVVAGSYDLHLLHLVPPTWIQNSGVTDAVTTYPRQQ